MTRAAPDYRVFWGGSGSFQPDAPFGSTNLASPRIQAHSVAGQQQEGGRSVQDSRGLGLCPTSRASGTTPVRGQRPVGRSGSFPTRSSFPSLHQPVSHSPMVFRSRSRMLRGESGLDGARLVLGRRVPGVRAPGGGPRHEAGSRRGAGSNRNRPKGCGRGGSRWPALPLPPPGHWRGILAVRPPSRLRAPKVPVGVWVWACVRLG